MDDSRLKRSTTGPASVLHDWFSVHRAMAGDVISLANLLGRPVLTADGSRVGRVDDVVVRWHADIAHPLVSGLLVQVEQGRGLLGVSDVTLAQSRAYLRRLPLTVRAPTLAVDDVALAHDVLDHQLVDVMGVKVVRAADIYLARTSQGWELAGVDVGFWAFVRRALPRRRKCPPPSRAVDWASVQAFVASTPGTARTGPGTTTDDSGATSKSLRLGSPAAELRKLRAKDVRGLLAELGRHQQAQLAALAQPSIVADALRQLQPPQLEALLAELDAADRDRLSILLSEGSQS